MPHLTLCICPPARPPACPFNHPSFRLHFLASYSLSHPWRFRQGTAVQRDRVLLSKQFILKIALYFLTQLYVVTLIAPASCLLTFAIIRAALAVNFTMFLSNVFLLSLPRVSRLLNSSFDFWASVLIPYGEIWNSTSGGNVSTAILAVRHPSETSVSAYVAPEMFMTPDGDIILQMSMLFPDIMKSSNDISVVLPGNVSQLASRSQDQTATNIQFAVFNSIPFFMDQVSYYSALVSVPSLNSAVNLFCRSTRGKAKEGPWVHYQLYKRTCECVRAHTHAHTRTTSPSPHYTNSLLSSFEVSNSRPGACLERDDLIAAVERLAYRRGSLGKTQIKKLIKNLSSTSRSAQPLTGKKVNPINVSALGPGIH